MGQLTLQATKQTLLAEFNLAKNILGQPAATARKTALAAVLGYLACRKWQMELELYAATLS